MVAVLHARPEIDLPRQAPACSHVAALGQRGSGSAEEFRMSVGRYLVGGIESVEMRDVPVVIIRIVGIIEPFLQLAILPDLHGRQQGQRLLYGVLQGLVLAQYAGRTERVGQGVGCNLVVHGATGRDGRLFSHGRMLRRDRRSHDQPPFLRMGYHIRKVEQGRSFHGVIVTIEKLLVAREEIVLPQVCGQPCSATGIHAPVGTVDDARGAPDVGVVMCHPSTAAIHVACRGLAGLCEVFDEVEERLFTLRDVAHVGNPVVHFGIDIDGVFAVPRRIGFLVPHAL